MKAYYCLLLFYLMLPQVISAQVNSLLEIQGAFGWVGLNTSGERAMLSHFQPTLFNEEIRKLEFKGRNFEIGFLGTYQLNDHFYGRMFFPF